MQINVDVAANVASRWLSAHSLQHGQKKPRRGGNDTVKLSNLPWTVHFSLFVNKGRTKAVPEPSPVV